MRHCWSPNGSSEAEEPERPRSEPPVVASRRKFLKLAAAVGATAVLPDPGFAANVANDQPETGWIDVHSHVTPPILIETVGAGPLGIVAKWTPEKALDAMDESGVATAMLSVPPHFDPSTVDRIARPSNEYAARLAVDHPGRFGVLAFLPMPHVDTTLREIEYSFDTLKVQGVGMYTNYGDKWLGDPAFNPVFEELDRRKAIVFTHPITADCCKNLLPGINDGVIEWQTDTSRAIAQMVFGGAAGRYPNVRMIWSHGGGTMPFLIGRFTRTARSPQFAPRFPGGFEAAAAKFYYDTAQVSNPAAMSALAKVAPISQILFGTDYPYRTVADEVQALRTCGVLSVKDLLQVGRGNAQVLFQQSKT